MKQLKVMWAWDANPTQLTQEKMEFLLPPNGTDVKKLKQNKEFTSPENACLNKNQWLAFS